MAGFSAWVRGKKTPILIGLFVIVLVIAVGGITLGVVQSGSKDEGYHAVAVQPDAQVVAFDSGVTFMLYAQGNSNAIKQRLNQASAAYSDTLDRCYRLLDAVNEYEGYANLATLGRHPGQPYSVGDELFKVLTDAYQKTQADQGYSLFQGALYQEWRAILYLEDPTEFDPLNNPDVAARLQAIAEMTARGDLFSLRVVDEATRTVAFECAPEYQAFAAEREIAHQPLDLNLLHDAYLLQLIAHDMESQGFADGYLYTDSGLCVSLGRDDALISLYGCVDNAVRAAVDVPIAPGAVFCQMTAFPMTDNPYGYYAFDAADGAARYRHPWIDMRAGVCRDVWMSAAAMALDRPLSDLVYGLLAVTRAENADDVRAACERLGQSCAVVAYTLQDAPNTICVRTKTPDACVPREDSPFIVQPF